MEQTIADLAAKLGGRVTPPFTWFDGFWDFVTEHRDRIEGGPAWEIQGHSSFPWAVLVVAPTPPVQPEAEIHVFVDAKDRRPGVWAPGPVCTLAVTEGTPIPVGATPTPSRPIDVGLAQALREAGFEPAIGYWGIHCLWAGDLDAAREKLFAVPGVLDRALKLARSLLEIGN